MKEVTINLNKWYHWLIASLPLLGLLGSLTLWVDTRHMHKDIADIRWLDVQILIIDGHILDYTRIENPTTADTIAYELSRDQLNLLKGERSKELGLGDLPQ